MFIVHVVRQFHPGIGGLENGVLDLASAQVEAGNRVRVVTLNRLFNDKTRRTLPPREMLDGIEIVRIPYCGSQRYPLAPAVLAQVAGADIVHVHAIDFFFDYLAWTKPLHGRTLVVSTHGGFFHTQFASRLKQAWFATVTRASLKFYAAVSAVSASDFERFGAVRPRGMVFIENGANVAKFFDASAQRLQKSIVSIGRFSANKRLDRLVAFARALRRQDPEWKLTIAGRQADLSAEDVRALVDRAGLSEAVDVIDSPSDDEVRSLMGKSSFAASASDYEGFGMSAVEGMSAGLVPILSPIPPFRRLAGRTGLGLILDFAHPDAAVRRLIRNLPRLAAQRAACMKAAIAYDWRHVCEKFAALYAAATGTGVRTILDVPIQAGSFDETARLIDARFESGERIAIAFANAHTLNVAASNSEFRQTLQSCLVLNDGLGVDLASRVLYGSPFPENLNGTDFSPNYLLQTKHRFRIFMLGATPGTAERAGLRLSLLCPQHQIVGCHHGHFDPARTSEIADLVRRSRADVVLVAMGNPKQELFLRDHLAATGCRLGIGVGALFDFLAGKVPRAPSFVRRWRLEWAYRLANEPRRLAARYLIGNPLFLARIAAQWWSGARVQSLEPDVLASGLRDAPRFHETVAEETAPTQEVRAA
jgi:alpha-1,3-mannosyltransferase